MGASGDGTVGSATSLDERKLALERDRLDFEMLKWEAERAQGDEKKRSPWASPLLVAILTAAAAAGGNAVVSRLNADGQVRLERLRGEQGLITEMIKTGGDAEKTVANLRFLIESGLVTDERADRMRAYLNRTGKRPDLLPSLAATGDIATSAVERARVAAAKPTTGCRPTMPGGYCIVEHVLTGEGGTPVDIVDARGRGGKLAVPPIAIVLHATGGPDGSAKVAFTRSNGIRTSAHVEINRDGTVSQFVPFDVAAFHAGRDEWNGITRLNQRTIAVEFANWMGLEGRPGAWRGAWGGPAIPNSAVFVRTDPRTGKVGGWERFTEAQLRAGDQVIAALLAAYPSIRAVLTHEEIARPRGRKWDPGPAMPIERYRRLVARAGPGRAE